jgi:hypothetical protein
MGVWVFCFTLVFWSVDCLFSGFVGIDIIDVLLFLLQQFKTTINIIRKNPKVILIIFVFMLACIPICFKL